MTKKVIPLTHKQCVYLLKNREISDIKISPREEGFICTFRQNRSVYFWGTKDGEIKYMVSPANWVSLIYRNIDITTEIKFVP